MDHSIIDEIKSRLDVVDVIGSYIKLQKVGSNYRGLCPFHNDHHPSLYVSPSRQIWKCFVCGAGGDVFKFVEMIEGVEFGDALRILAKKAGIKLTRQNPVIQTQRQNLYDICETATRFFEKQLNSTKAGQEVRQYLLARGLKKETISFWRLGYAPNTWYGLSGFLIKRGFEIDDILKSGLSLPSKENRPEFHQRCYDRFRGRIMFPIFDLNSQVIAFTGRIFREEANKNMGKYVNTTNNLIFNKSKVLYGLDKARIAIRENDFAIIMEGQMDVILSYQAGVKNVVASSGTSLTSEQLKIIKRYSNNLVTSFDMDAAGNSATERGIRLAQAQGFNVSVITMPPGLDPADVVSKKGNEEWKKVVKNRKSILDFYFDYAFSKFDSSRPEGKKKISGILLPIIKAVSNKIEQSSWVKELSKKLDVKEEAIEEELKKTALSKTEEWDNENLNKREHPTIHQSRLEMLEDRLLSIFLYYPEVAKIIPQDGWIYISPELKNIFFSLQKVKKELWKDFSRFNFKPEIKDKLNQLSFKVEIEMEQSESTKSDLKKEFLVSLRNIFLIKIKKQLSLVSNEIKEAENKGEIERVKALSSDFGKLTKELVKYRNYEEK